jgi:phosphoribosylcarboxyaminoimidazole (NCAIR) mutase
MAQKMTTKKIARLQVAKNCTFLEALSLHFQVSVISAQRAQKKTEISKFIRKTTEK